jgi:RNA polymerase sigma-70 factor (ECF subfamily)
LVCAAADIGSPDAERAWTATLLEQAAARLRAEHEAAGKGRQFDQLTEFRLDSAGQRSYRAAADALEMSESALKSATLRLRRRHHQLVRGELADTVGDPAEVDDEIRHLLTVVGR